MSGCCESSKIYSSSSENKYAQLHEFLHCGDTIGLTLHASKVSLSSYIARPNMHETRFALYKLPMQVSVAGQEYAGLWGGTFGWPPGRPSADKSGKALFFLLLSYEERQKGKRLTKILEGTRYVLHPNGSAMFIVNIDDPSLEPFPWNTDGDSLSFDLKYTFVGEGIANGYGFSYPSSKPGSLFVFEDGLLAFMWNPIVNFSYLTKSYSNVFTGFSSHT